MTAEGERKSGMFSRLFARGAKKPEAPEVSDQERQEDSPAEITLRGLSFTDAVILRNGEECPPEDGCTLLSYEGGTAVFRVDSWSGSRTEYSIGERP